MKVTLIFLLFFVSFSYQQRWAPAYPIPNEFVYYPGYFYQGSPYYYYNNIEDLNEDSDVEGRNKLDQQSPAHSRRFLLPNFLSNMLLPYYTTSTKTVYKAVTSTTTVASIQSCISSAQFMMGFQPPGGVAGSITPCARRRRDLLEDLIEKKDDITPSQVEPLIPTEVMQDDINQAIIPEISSSLMESNEEESVVRNRRSRAMITIFSTITSTITSYSFSVYTVKKFYTLVSLSSLLCLPNGYTVC